jgi:hypothetical protein
MRIKIEARSIRTTNILNMGRQRERYTPVASAAQECSPPLCRVPEMVRLGKMESSHPHIHSYHLDTVSDRQCKSDGSITTAEGPPPLYRGYGQS